LVLVVVLVDRELLMVEVVLQDLMVVIAFLQIHPQKRLQQKVAVAVVEHIPSVLSQEEQVATAVVVDINRVGVLHLAELLIKHHKTQEFLILLNMDMLVEMVIVLI
jgi:cytochrome c biogenesis protein ResB